MPQRNHIDMWLLIVVLALMVLSLGVVYSASAEWSLKKYETQNYFLDLHITKVLVGLFALFLGLSIPYWVYKGYTKATLTVAVILLFITILLGGETKGAVRWLRMGGFGFQPSEFAKFALLFHISALLDKKGMGIREVKNGFLPVAFWIGLVSLLILAQPNLSMGLMLFILTIILLFIGRARLLHLFSLILVASIIFSFYIFCMAYIFDRPYQLNRMLTFFNFESANRYNYQLWQGIIGFGNGGLFGVGAGESRQRDLFLPESYNDFVYAIIGEEYGLVGTLLVLSAFLFIFLRGFRIAKHAGDNFGRFLAMGITITITLYALVNAGVALGILPTTGLPMPFVSYGGTSLVFSAFAIGVLLNISAYTDLRPRLGKSKNRESDYQQVTGLGKVY